MADMMKSMGGGKRKRGMMGKVGADDGARRRHADAVARKRSKQLQKKLGGAGLPRAPPGGIPAAPPPDAFSPSRACRGSAAELCSSGLNPFGKKK